MDGAGKVILHQDNLERPYAITIDFDNQVIYWADSNLHRIECSNADGSSRRVVVSSGIDEPFDITLLGDMIYVSDQNVGIRVTNKSGGLTVQTVYNEFCSYINTLGLQVVAEERQLQGE